MKLPKIKSPATGDRTIRLADFAGEIVVLYFYPRDATPGCTTEGRDFTALAKKFTKLGAVIYGVSRDTVASHEKFKAKEGYAFDLISDADEKLCAAFDVIKLKQMYGREVRGIERSTFVFGADGTLAREWRKVSVPGHAAEVLDFVRSIADAR